MNYTSLGCDPFTFKTVKSDFTLSITYGLCEYLGKNQFSDSRFVLFF